MMAAIPEKPQSQTVAAIYSWWANKLEQPRAYLGGSVIGQECERRLWYSWRWCQPPGQEFDGRMRRLFNRGHREEAVFVQELRGIGVQVHDLDPATGQQFRFKAVGGHCGVGLDAVLLGVPEAPKTYHLGEFKTHSAKNFATLKKGVMAAKPEHYAQMMIGMHWAKLTRALYLAVNKDTDALYSERVRYDPSEAARLEAKAERIVYAQEPLVRISDDPESWQCRFCTAKAVCHEAKMPPVNCRTCLHATPEKDGDGRWSCARWGADIPVDAQRKGCPEHLYIPALVTWGEAVDASEAERWVEYRASDGFVFRNGPWGVGSFTSKELAASTPDLLRHPEFQRIRIEMAGVIVEREEW